MHYQKLPIPLNDKAFDYLVSQLIDQYRDLPPHEAHLAIADDWHEQMTAILEAALFITPKVMRPLQEVSRLNDPHNCTFFIPTLQRARFSDNYR